MEDYITDTVRAYDDTETYEKSTKKLIPKQEIDKFISMVKPVSLILDAGCAFGRDTEYIISRGYEVKGIDLSTALVKRAKELYPKYDFSIQDVRRTNFADQMFGGIWCNATLLHLKDEDIEEALREFNRILKPAGILAVSLKKGSGAKSFIEKFSSNRPRFYNFKTKEEFRKSLEGAGFKEKESYYINEQQQFGPDKRDLVWLYSFSEKK